MSEQTTERPNSSSWRDDDGGEYCIESKQDPSMGLCGAYIYGESMPDCEIPSESRCKDCEAILNRLGMEWPT